MVNKINFRLGLYAVLLAALLITGYWRLHQYAKEKDSEIASPILPPADEEKLLVDNLHHTITVVRRDGKKAPTVTRRYLNPRGEVSIEETRTRTIKIDEREWGTEFAPFSGVTFGTDAKFRGALGLDLIYFRNVDLGIGLLYSSKLSDTRSLFKCTYNVYSNFELGLGVDNHKTVHILAGVRF